MPFASILRAASAGMLLVLAVSGAMLPAWAEAPTVVIDWSKGNIQDTDASCGEITLNNLKDKHNYALVVKGGTSGTCRFTAAGLTIRTPPGFGPTAATTHTIFTFIRTGTDVYVNWSKGY